MLSRLVLLYHHALSMSVSARRQGILLGVSWIFRDSRAVARVDPIVRDGNVPSRLASFS